MENCNKKTIGKSYKILNAKGNPSLSFLLHTFFVNRLGFEPRTHSLEGCCSIQLSYRSSFFET